MTLLAKSLLAALLTSCRRQVLPALMAMIGIAWSLHVGQCVAQGTGAAANAGLLQQASLISANGNPYGVGQVEIPIALAIENGWHSDQSLEVDSSDCEVWFTAHLKVTTSKSDDESRTDDEGTGELLRIFFLYRGANPSAIELHISGKAGLTIRSQNANAPHHELMQGWWEALHNQPSAISPALRELTNDMLFSIGKHLDMPLKLGSAAKDVGSSELEQQFERTVGMLLGFESVRLAMMFDREEDSIGSTPAMHPLPSAVRVTSQQIPGFGFDSTVIEPIASLVPHDCYYVRCGSISNYMWLRQFLIGWGGSLDEIVTNPTLNTDVRSRIEDQLGVYSDAWLDTAPFVSDMAVIGSDLFFSEGAGIGILLEAKPGDVQKLEAAIQQQRVDKAKRLGASHHTEIFAEHSVSCFRTTDNRMRSFFVRHGRYLLITNSQAMLTAVTSPQAASRSLANLPEYRYAIASNPPRPQAGITIYLSDPFIRRLTSPACRIEFGRRRASAVDCRRLEVASMVAEAFGQQLNSRQSLIQHDYLPRDFGVRPDGSHVELQQGVACDSLRGKVGAFVPVADVATTAANQQELSAFANFAEHYRREWQAVDPVLVSIASSTIDESAERVELQIHITPYAQQEYRFLTNYLSMPSGTHAVMSRGELMGLSARLKTPSREFLAHLGLVDAHVPFRIYQGELLRMEGATGTFLQQQSFAAVTPTGTDGLQAISSLMLSLQNHNEVVPEAAQSPTASRSASSFNPYNLALLATNPANLAISSSRMLVRGLLAVAKLGALYEDDQWSIYGGSSEFRRAVRESLGIQNLTENSQLLFHAGGIDRSEVAPYLNAYSYCQSRNQSAAVASWLNQWSSGLRSEPQNFRRNVEQALQGELMCPLGGEFRLAEHSHVWTSSMWQKNSLALEDHVPQDYRFPFLHWLKEVDLSFNLTPTSLQTEVAIQVARANGGGVTPLELQPFSRQQLAAPTATVPWSPAFPMIGPRRIPATMLSFGLTQSIPPGLTNATFSNNGEHLLVGGFDRTAHLLDLQSLNEIRVLRGHEHAIWTAALSPDGNMAVTGSEDRTLRFWNTKTGLELHRILAGGIYSCVRFSPDGNSVFATNWDGKVRIIDVSNFRVKSIIECGRPTLDISIFKDGQQFVVGTPSGEIFLYGIGTKQVAKQFAGHAGKVHSVALFSDGKHFLSASHDHTLRLWNVATGSTEAIYRGHTAAVHEVRLVPNESQFVSCSADGTVRLWNVNSEMPLASINAGNDVRGISISPDGSSIAAACMDGKLRLLKLQ